MELSDCEDVPGLIEDDGINEFKTMIKDESNVVQSFYFSKFTLCIVKSKDLYACDFLFEVN